MGVSSRCNCNNYKQDKNDCPFIAFIFRVLCSNLEAIPTAGEERLNVSIMWYSVQDY